jgi:hypothetical protein
MKTMMVLVLVVTAAQAGEKKYQLHVDADELYYGVVKRENPAGDVNAVGDKHLRHKAYGLLQIRKPYLDDVNKIAGKDVKAVWGKTELTLADMKNPEMARWAFLVYLWYYGEQYERTTGKVPTATIYARIHNGGPNGWQRKSTLAYARAVVQNIR